MIELAAAVIVVIAAIYLLGLAVSAIFAPAYVRRFLNRFAATAGAHYAEMFLRLIAGGAFVVYAPHMLWSNAFLVLGWVLLLSTAVLLLLPWRWHQRFARLVIPPMSKHVWLMGIVSPPLAGVILFAVFAVK